ncbi:alpha/beta hydrolase-fold protein [Chryseolinea sp. H1M3-3]|jgi:predicted alpha/beta superfamily hydrolase|uniref:alpha/beta hydrolase-fold protein n=1 Tax=Chryseolinea sp. H1M3-3 TaxID=3034144 RepID=UPI0023EAA5E5|nr:alpha/beta hydrolase-fold protein [Chryseolinea sp. H1M3-3]
MTVSNLVPVCIILLLTSSTHYTFSQIQITGNVVDARSGQHLSYVNIGIKNKDIGTVSREDGSFRIEIPSKFQFDSITFSMVGYYESTLPIQNFVTDKVLTIRLSEKITQLKEIVIAAEKLVEKKYGIRKRGLIHFTDGIFKEDDSFEIGQVINLGNSHAHITSINLHINSPRSDSANFRINFYKYDVDENIPRERIIDKSILQRHPIKEGWLKFDLSQDNILLKGSVLAAIEFIPDNTKDVSKIFYEVKIGGASKSFFRRTSLGQWTRPPHHYCLFVTALTNKNAPNEPDDVETTPTFTLKSDFSNEPFSFFVRVPKNYAKNSKKLYPVIYLLDGNAFFDPTVDAVARYRKKKKSFNEPIIVGIGYENAYVMDSLRHRDYTFPAALGTDSLKISGQGYNFHQFIKTRVISHIDSSYRTDKTNRTIMGHSLGGYFVLFALTQELTDTLVFNNFVAASPSIYYHDGYLIEQIKSSLNYKKRQPVVELFLTIGELEIIENESNGLRDLLKTLAEKEQIRVRSKVYKNMEHMGTAIPTFENGIQSLLNKQNLSGLD